MRALRFLIAAITALALPQLIAGAEPAAQYEGSWSAPSVSNPATPFICFLLPEGKATEQVGEYRGKGTWRVVDGEAVISWESGWTNVLRPAGKGGFELLTWREGRATREPPDDVQPARRVE